MSKHLIFCYGSLKFGKPNHKYFLDGIPMKDTAVTRGVMYDLGAFPAVTLHGDGQIHGELYEVDDRTLARLDRLEGYNPNGGGLYDRAKIETPHGPAWIYTMDNDQELSNYRRVASGNW